MTTAVALLESLPEMSGDTSCTSDELWQAYRKARLRYAGISFHTALLNPLIYKSLVLQVQNMRKTEQHRG